MNFYHLGARFPSTTPALCAWPGARRRRASPRCRRASAAGRAEQVRHVPTKICCQTRSDAVLRNCFTEEPTLSPVTLWLGALSEPPAACAFPAPRLSFFPPLSVQKCTQTPGKSAKRASIISLILPCAVSLRARGEACRRLGNPPVPPAGRWVSSQAHGGQGQNCHLCQKDFNPVSAS